MEDIIIRYAWGNEDALLWQMIDAALPRDKMIALLQDCPDVLEIEVRDFDDDLILHSSHRAADGEWYDETVAAQEATCVSGNLSPEDAQQFLDYLVKMANADI